jgi:hypothetical protein
MKGIPPSDMCPRTLDHIAVVDINYYISLSAVCRLPLPPFLQGRSHLKPEHKIKQNKIGTPLLFWIERFHFRAISLKVKRLYLLNMKKQRLEESTKNKH